MKSLTLHALDDQLAGQIKRRASELSISMNELAKRILAEGLGIKRSAESPHKAEFECFCGSWTDSDVHEFEERTDDMRQVDAGDWS